MYTLGSDGGVRIGGWVEVSDYSVCMSRSHNAECILCIDLVHEGLKMTQYRVETYSPNITLYV